MLTLILLIIFFIYVEKSSHFYKDEKPISKEKLDRVNSAEWYIFYVHIFIFRHLDFPCDHSIAVQTFQALSAPLL